MDHQVELDRRMLDWIVGLDTEMNELVEGSHLYTPKVFCLLLSPNNQTAELPKYLEEALSLSFVVLEFQFRLMTDYVNLQVIAEGVR